MLGYHKSYQCFNVLVTVSVKIEIIIIIKKKG